MDSFEFNKIAGWVLSAFVVLLGVSIGTTMAFKPVKPAKPSYIVEGVEAEASAAAGPAAAPDKPIAFYLASADVAKGEASFKKCGACHNNVKGGPAGIGPNLYGIVGNVHAHSAGFAYSDAMLAAKGKPWSWDELDKWIASPKTYMPGNKMSFAGISKPEDRANVLAYLNSASDKPLPLPPVPAEAAAAAPATEAPAAAGAATPEAEAAKPAA